MIHLVRDSFFGQCLRFFTRGRVFHYPEELDPSIWERYINETKSANLATHGKTEVPERQEMDPHRYSDGRTRRSSSEQNSSKSVVEPAPHTLQGKKDRTRRVDAEKGRDLYLVDWYGPDDPEVRLR